MPMADDVTEYAHSLILFGEVEHSRCPEYDSGDFERDYGEVGTDGRGEHQRVGAHSRNSACSTDTARSRETSRDERPEEECVEPANGEDVQATLESAGSSHGNQDQDARNSSDSVPSSMHGSSNGASKELVCTQTATGQDSAKWSDVETDM